MPDISILWSPAPYHILSYGTLLGSSVYQSFINGIVSYRALPRPQFSTLQSALLPIFFTLQTALPVVLALTYPGPLTSTSSLTTTPTITRSPSSLPGVLAPENRWSVLLPLTSIFILNAVNLFYMGPVTTRIMKERKHQETRDGKRYHDPGPHSKEMERLNGRFGRMHGASALTNLVALGVTVVYGVLLSERL